MSEELRVVKIKLNTNVRCHLFGQACYCRFTDSSACCRWSSKARAESMAPGNQRAGLSQTTHESADSSGQKPKVKRLAEKTFRGREREKERNKCILRLPSWSFGLSVCQTDRSSIHPYIHPLAAARAGKARVLASQHK